MRHCFDLLRHSERPLADTETRSLVEVGRCRIGIVRSNCLVAKLLEVEVEVEKRCKERV